MRRYWTLLAGALAATLFGAWGVASVVLDTLGRIDMLKSFASSGGIGHRALAWLFSTPSCVPPLIAAMALGAWAYFTYKVLFGTASAPLLQVGHSPVQDERKDIPATKTDVVSAQYLDIRSWCNMLSVNCLPAAGLRGRP